MKVNYNIACEVYNVARLIDDKLIYYYFQDFDKDFSEDNNNGGYYHDKYKTSQAKLIKQIIDKIRRLQKKYNWSNKRVNSFVKLVYAQFVDPEYYNYGKDNKLTFERNFSCWEDLLGYISFNGLQLHFWSINRLIKEEI